MPYIADTLIQLPPETDAAFNVRVQTYITDQEYYFTSVGGQFPAPNVPGGPDFLGYPPITPSSDVMVWDVVALQMVRAVTFTYENTYYYKFLGTAPIIPPPSPLPVAGNVAIFSSSYGVVDSGLGFDTVAVNFTNLGIATIAGQAVEYSQFAAVVAGYVTSVNSVLPVLGNVSLDTDDIPVGVTNLYTTNPITLAYVLTGFVAGGAGPITAADTILSAFESLQFQINTVSVPTLTQNQIAFGDASNEMTSSANLTWVEATKDLAVTGTIGIALNNTGNVYYVAQGNVGFWFTGAASTGLLSHQGFGIDFDGGNVYTMGDVGITNNTHIVIDDAARTIVLQEVNGVTVTNLASVATQVVFATSTGLLTGAATVPITNGGTGQATATLGFNSLSPLTTLGDTLYHNGTNNARMAGQITTAKQFLSQTGTGAVSAAPIWAAVAIGDITGLGTNVATFLATPSSANLDAAVTDGTGTGALVFGTSPTITNLIFAAGSTTLSSFTETSGTVKTTPGAGDHEFDGVVFYSSPVASARGISPSVMYATVEAGGYALTAGSATQAAFPSNKDTWTLEGSTSYYFEGSYTISKSVTTVTTAMSFTLGGGASVTSIRYVVNAFGGANNTTVTVVNNTVIVTVASVIVTATGVGQFTIFFKGIIRMNAGGTVVPSIKFSGTPTTPVMEESSYILFTPIGTNVQNSVGAVG